MTIETKTLEMPRGTDRDIVVTLLDAAGDPFDLTDAVLYFRIARRRGSVPVLEVEQAAMIIEANVVTIPITAEASATLSALIYRHELYIIRNDVRSVLMHGTVRMWDSQAALHEEES
jgi:hypothetical protein